MAGRNGMELVPSNPDGRRASSAGEEDEPPPPAAGTRSRSSSAWTESDTALEALYQEINTDKVYTGRSLFFLTMDNKFRRFVIRIVDSKYFDLFILLCIAVNCVFLAVADPTSVNPNPFLENAEYFFTAIFATEMILKITAMGFIMHKYAYLRDSWNWLDFSVVMLGLLSLLPGIQNYSAIRTFRVLRALRALSGIGGLRVVVNTLLKSLPPLLNVFALLAFFMVIFAVIGIQLFSGNLRYHCVDIETREFDPSEGNLCSQGGAGRTCEEGQECIMTGPNPGYGNINFDHFGYAIVTVLQLVTLDEWEVVLNAVMDTSSGWSAIYFVMVVLFGSLFIVNLVVAVVYNSYRTSLSTLNPQSEWDMFANKKDPLQVSDTAIGDTTVQTEDAEEVLEDEDKEPGFLGWLWNQIVDACFLIADHPYFTAFIVFVICLNTICLAVEYPGMDKKLAEVLYWLNIVFTIIFTGEVLIKFVGYGFRRFVEDRFNLFDTFIVVLSLIELMIGSSSGISVLRAFRLFRIFKLARSWSSLRNLLEIIIKSMSSVANITLVMCVLIFVFALMGMQLFGGQYEKLGEDKQRTNFDSFFNAFISVFRILIGEWTMPMYDAYRATNEGAIVYFILVLLVGNYLVLNLFLCVLLSNFEWVQNRSVEPDAATDKKPSKIKQWKQYYCGHCSGPPHRVHHDEDPDTPSMDAPDGGLSLAGVADIVIHRDDDGLEHGGSPVPAFKPLYGLSCHIWSTESTFRRQLQRVVENKWFDRVILVLIILSSAALALEHPQLDPKSELAKSLYILNLVFAAIFLIECVMKIVTYGFAMHYGAYLTDNWNRLDFTIVLISIVSLILTQASSDESSNLDSLRAIRTLRAFRPLRAITRNEGMKVVVNALFKSIPAIGNVCLVCLLFWLIFGILGVQFFGGRFGSCNNPDATGFDDCVPGTYFNTTIDGEEVTVEEEWTNPEVNFDHIFKAIIALFQVATFEGWYDIFFNAMDSTGVKKQPKEGNTPLAAFYFIAFITVGSFFIMNLFVGVVIDEFNRLKQEMEGHAFLTEGQRKWMEAQRMMLKFQPRKSVLEPENKTRKVAYLIVTQKYFDIFIMFVILCNMLAMCLIHEEMTPAFNEAMEITNLVFSAIFLIECVLKLVAYGPSFYFSDHWNKFDFFIVLVSVLGVASSELSALLPVNPTLLRILRVFRVARIFRIIKTAAGLRKLLLTLLYSLPSLFNIGCLLFLVFFVYAVLAMNFFGRLKIPDDANALSEEVNFRTFPKALLLLFRLSTSSGWNEVFADCSISPPDCDPAKGECGSFWFAAIFFSLFILVGFFIMVNLYVAVILENFDLASEEEKANVTSDDLQAYQETWTLFDPSARRRIHMEKHLKQFVTELEPPLGIGRAENLTEEELQQEIYKLNIPVMAAQPEDEPGWYVHFLDVLLALSKRVNEDVNLPRNMEAKIEKSIRRAFPDLQSGTAVTTTLEIGAARRIQFWYKEHMKKKAEEEAKLKAEAANGGDNAQSAQLFDAPLAAPHVQAQKSSPRLAPPPQHSRSRSNSGSRSRSRSPSARGRGSRSTPTSEASSL